MRLWIITLKIKQMKRVIVNLVFLFMVSGIIAQNDHLNKYFDIKLKDITRIVPEKQEYDVVIKRQTMHPVENKTYGGEVLKSTWLMYGNDSIIWQNVRWSKIDDILQEPKQTVDWNEFNGRSHKIGAIDDMFQEDFYSGIPEEKREWARTMTSDVPWFEYGWSKLDSLEFQKEYFDKNMDNKEASIEGVYTFLSLYLKFIWSGITLHNNEICAIVKFESFNNQITNYWEGQMTMKGRDSYYGELWISLNTKQTEYFYMVEDVVGEFYPNTTLFETQRTVTINKVK